MVGVATVHEVVVITDDRSTFSDRNILGILETEATRKTDAADASAVIFGQVGLTGILYHDQVILPGDGHDPIHIRGYAQDMDRKDCLGPGGDFLPYLFRIDLESAPVDIRENGDRSIQQDGLH